MNGYGMSDLGHETLMRYPFTTQSGVVTAFVHQVKAALVSVSCV